MNPLLFFVRSAEAQLGTLVSGSRHRVLPVTEETRAFELRRNFATDLLHRAKTLWFAYERLCELTARYREIDAAMRANQAPGSIDLSIVPEETLRQRERWIIELEVITLFTCYETTSVVLMLKQWGIDVRSEAAELNYLVEVRNKLLAHGQLKGVMRTPATGFSVPVARPGIAALAVLGLGGTSVGPEREEARQANEELVMSHKKAENYDDAEVRRLHEYGVREPRIELALHQLAGSLVTRALPLIEGIRREATNRFGYEGGFGLLRGKPW